MKFWIGTNPDVTFVTSDTFNATHTHWVELTWEVACTAPYIMILVDKDKTWQLWEFNPRTLLH